MIELTFLSELILTNLLMMHINCSDIAILNINSADYCCIISRNSKKYGHKLNAKCRFDRKKKEHYKT